MEVSEKHTFSQGTCQRGFAGVGDSFNFYTAKEHFAGIARLNLENGR